MPLAPARPVARRVTATLTALAVAAGVLLALAASAVPARADTPIAHGYDVSWPQCPAGVGTTIPGTSYGVGLGNPMPPTTTDFMVIGLTAGLPFYRNPCLADQVRYAVGNGIPRGVYTMAAYPTPAQLSSYGAKGPRSGSTLSDQLFNTGYAMAQFDLSSLHVVGLSVPFVWIDVETRPKAPTPPNWPTNNAANNITVLQGIAAGFRAAGIATGWYSVRTAWGYTDTSGTLHPGITGAWQDGGPMWRAGDYDPTLSGYAAAESICNPPLASVPSLNGGPIWMGQRVSGSYDLDATCQRLPSLATFLDGIAPPSLAPLSPAQAWMSAGGAATFSSSLGVTQLWSATLTDVCAPSSAAPLRSWNGMGKGSLTLTWDGTDGSGSPAPPGIYRLTVTSSGLTRSALAELTAPGSSPLGMCPATRSYGPDRYATSVALGQQAAPVASVAVLASGADAHLVDGLVAAPLAKALGAPLLLTQTDQLSPSVRADLLARGTTQVEVIGGPAAVSATVVSALVAMGMTVTRVYGSDRYGTAVALAHALVKAGGGTDGVAWIASGAEAHLVDALAAGGVAAASGEPILLTAPTQLPGTVATELKTLGTTSTMVLGGTAAIADAVTAKLPSPTRLAGADRFATAAAVAARAGASPVEVEVALGTDTHLVDALSSGALGHPLLLTQTDMVPSATAGALASTRPGRLRVIGGPAVLTPSTALALVTAATS